MGRVEDYPNWTGTLEAALFVERQVSGLSVGQQEQRQVAFLVFRDFANVHAACLSMMDAMPNFKA